MPLALDPQTGYLPAEPQLHPVIYDDLQVTFVEPYPHGHRRCRIWDAYMGHNGTIASFFSSRRLEQWVDGGFTTTKNEPEDIDIVTYLPKTELVGLNSEVQDRIKRCFRGSRSHPEGLVDSYCVPYEEDDSGNPTQLTIRHQEYWKQVFGSDRDNTPKGIAVVMVGDGNA